MTLFHQFAVGDTVRIYGDTIIYKVLAVTNTLVTILIMNPQPDGTQHYFSSTSLQSIDASRLEKVQVG
ncbi:hypothetical protein B0H66DRAFT_485632 [Apodospora peruviana]|uniref:Uncharacterized protein n=1 Tax=Apodospora peruviana TaxID=516989 RepID=A0AAE0LZ07_9PEZI|nr:hypothetical protein B0H66DRAFT_485632 [Apodospora peruviana]